MKTIILAAAAALVLSTGAALAGDGDGQSYNQPFTAWAGLNNVPGQSKTMIANNPSASQTYATQSHSGFYDFSVHQDS